MDKMTLAEFRQLSVPHRAHATWNRGTFLACVDTGRAGRSLYYLNGFYVELIYDFQDNRVLGVFPFRDAWHLADWLERINITELLNA